MAKSTKRRLTASDLFNCEDLSDFAESIVKVLPFNGASMSRFYECEIDSMLFLTKLCFYRKTPAELYDVSGKNVISHADAEIAILMKLQEKIIQRNISPCIIELVYYKVCSTKNIIPGIKACESIITNVGPGSDLQYNLCKYADLVKNNLAYPKCAFLVLDKCDISLDIFLRKNTYSAMSTAIFKSVIFQIIYTLQAIRGIYPKFQHYDLHTENIMLKYDYGYEFRADSPKYLQYTVGKKKYFVPYFGIIPKIIDFGFSALPEEGLVSNATEDKYRMYYRTENDILFLFHWIYNTVARDGEYASVILDVLHQLEPNQSFTHYHTEYIRKMGDKIPSYREMLNNKIWKDYLRPSVPKSQVYKEFTAIK